MRALPLTLLLVITTLPIAVPALGDLPDVPHYPWLLEAEDGPTAPLSDLVAPPRGFARVPASPHSLAGWMRDLPVRTDRTEVHAYDGRELSSPSAHVVALDVGVRDLQQCADSAIRLLSEYAWATGRADELAWDFTSGDRTRWADWLAGERFVIGRTVERRVGAARSNTRSTFRRWLDLVFTYAGTRSIAREGEAVGDKPVEAGDVYVSAGSPGHAVIVVDVATHSDGRRAALLAQGYMPAQELHILRARRDAISPTLDGIWFVLPTTADGVLDTPSWAPFRAGDARRIAPVR
ncbi:MAG: hypothetical protein KDA24_15680 [Deltaproteobacteria bacterium]|nr:hypothetical protein [Deltaproteobacteria bacterium]